MDKTVELAALALGALYLTGTLKGQGGQSAASSIGQNIGQGIGAGAAGGAIGLGQGVIIGAATQIPAANQTGPYVGVGNWTIPISGGYVQGSPAQIVSSMFDHPEVLWNSLPFLPDYTGGKLLPWF